MLSSLGSEPDTLRPWFARIVDLLEQDFATLVNAAQWFAAHPSSGYTVRQVPVPGMHTNWLARRRRLVMAALNTVNGLAAESDDAAERDDLTQADLDPLGPRALPPAIDLILADPDDQQRHGGLRHLQAPAPEIARLILEPTQVLIVENKESAMIVPDAPGLVVIHSLGNNLESLAAIPWLEHAECWY